MRTTEGIKLTAAATLLLVGGCAVEPSIDASSPAPSDPAAPRTYIYGKLIAVQALVKGVHPETGQRTPYTCYTIYNEESYIKCSDQAEFRRDTRGNPLVIDGIASFVICHWEDGEPVLNKAPDLSTLNDNVRQVNLGRFDNDSGRIGSRYVEDTSCMRSLDASTGVYQEAANDLGKIFRVDG
jgi:hypothetical protein